MHGKSIFTKKGGADLNALAAIIGIFIAGFVIIYNTVLYDRAHENALENQYQLSQAESAIRAMQQSFQKSALFFGIMNVSKELGSHGGVTSKAVSAAKNTLPKMNITGGIPYWAVSRCKEETSAESEIRKRVPFIYYSGANKIIGKKEQEFLIVPESRYGQNIDDVSRKGYAFNLAVAAFFMKPANLKLSVCQSEGAGGSGAGISKDAGCSEVSTIASDGLYIYSLDSSKITDASKDVRLKMASDADNSVSVRLIAVSIYDKEIALSPSQRLAENLEQYRKKVETYSDESINGTVEKMDGYFLPSSDNIYASGIADSKLLTAKKGNSLDAVGSGVAEEGVKIRYWKLYGMAQYFVDNLDGLVKKRINDGMNADFEDYSAPSKETDGAGPSCSVCADDEAPEYKRDDFYNSLAKSLKSVESDLNMLYAKEGIVWNITAPSELFSGCGANAHKSYCDAAAIDGCDNQADNIEHYEYKKSKYYLTQSRRGWWGGVWHQTNRCDAYYAHRYVFKNVKVLVSIKDEAYAFFDEDEKKWAPLEFKFFVELDRIDDNLCGAGIAKSIACDSLSGALPSAPGITILSPQDQSDVSGSIKVLGMAYGASNANIKSNIKSIAISVCGEEKYKGSLENSAFEWVWDTAKETDGLKIIEVAAGGSGASPAPKASLNVNVKNSARPKVSIASPSAVCEKGKAIIAWKMNDPQAQFKLEYGGSQKYGACEPCTFAGVPNTVCDNARTEISKPLESKKYYYKITLKGAGENYASATGDFTC